MHNMRAVGDLLQLTISDSSTSIAGSSVPDTARALVLVVEGNVRMRLDGTAPTANNGMLIYEGQTLTLSKNDAAKVKFIRTGGSNVTAQGHWMV
jgi:redox-sensitive bicupin YhaK (pirin superfamily)